MSLFQRLLFLASTLSIIPGGSTKTEGIALGMAAGITTAFPAGAIRSIHFRFACDAGQKLGDKIGNGQ